jgi:uncharacterized protein YqeY
MLIDEIRKANVEALKAHDEAAKSVFGLIISRYLELKTNGSGNDVTDADVLAIIVKFDKELDEEKEGYVKAGRTESAKKVEEEKKALARFLPKLMSETEIRAVIATLPDKSLPSVMRYFKEKYAGKADMSLVSKIARGL